MPRLTEKEKELLGPPISPFETSDKPADQKVLRTGEEHYEEFQRFMHNATDNGKPREGYVELAPEEIDLLREEGRYREKCFLWVIDEDSNSIKMIRETTRNVLRTHDPCVCHTNLTGGRKAYLGGELFFSQDGSIYISPKSDRYRPRSVEQWQTALEYFRRVGYVNLVDIREWLVLNM